MDSTVSHNRLSCDSCFLLCTAISEVYFFFLFQPDQIFSIGIEHMEFHSLEALDNDHKHFNQLYKY